MKKAITLLSSNLSILSCAWKNSLRETVENSKEELDEGTAVLVLKCDGRATKYEQYGTIP